MVCSMLGLPQKTGVANILALATKVFISNSFGDAFRQERIKNDYISTLCGTTFAPVDEGPLSCSSTRCSTPPPLAFQTVAFCITSKLPP